jgi:inosine/xanthosine triphosphate pyrophosphatase family protein
MIVTDEILNEWSFRCHDGVVDLNDPKKVRILKEILDENGIDLEEQDEESPSAKSFDALIESKNLKRETKDKVITVLSEVEKQKIIDNLSNDISTVISFLNNNPELIRKTFDIKEGDMGRGEVTLIIASSDGQKIAKKGELGDVSVGNKAY